MEPSPAENSPSSVPAPPVAAESSPSESSASPEVTIIPLKSPEEAAREAVTQDLLWLTHEGYVTEYADTRLESVPPPKNPAKPTSETPATDSSPASKEETESVPK